MGGFRSIQSLPDASDAELDSLIGIQGNVQTQLDAAGKIGGASFVIGAEAADVINVAIQLTDLLAADLAISGAVHGYLSDNADGSTLAAAAPSGGVAIGTDGLILPVVAGKEFWFVSESDGDIDIDITEVGVATWYLVIILPSGGLAISGAITFA